jgi:hypothetical protein
VGGINDSTKRIQILFAEISKYAELVDISEDALKLRRCILKGKDCAY